MSLHNIIPPAHKQFQIVLLEGVHFSGAQQYCLHLIQNFCVISWLSDHNQSSMSPGQPLTRSHNQKTTLIKIVLQRQNFKQVFFVKEKRQPIAHQVQYCFGKSQKDEYPQDHFDLRVHFKIEIDINIERRTQAKLIRLVIQFDKNQPLLSIVMPILKKIDSTAYVYKRCFCCPGRRESIAYPAIKPKVQEEQGQNNLILVLNQKNMKQLPFFAEVLRSLLNSGKKIPKIIGHPASLLLTLLIAPGNQYDQTIANIILKSQSQFTFKHQVPKGSEASLLKLRQFVSLVIGQQSLLQASMVDFLAESLANNQFEAHLIDLIKLYYKMFLHEQVCQAQIIDAILHEFYISSQQQIANGTNYFSTFIKCIEFKHDQHHKAIMRLVEPQLRINNKPLAQLTIFELYQYNKVEFTFIGLDLDDQTVRFFNHQTTPQLPIASVLALVQALPTPYKSIIWKESWGKYTYYQNGLSVSLDLTGHEIIDSRFILQSPLDLLEDKNIKQGYFSDNVSLNWRIQAIVSEKAKAENLGHLQQIKTLLKAMKNSAIDSLPKLRLIWKILTTKTRVDIDINNVQTLCQIPILEKVYKLNQTLKYYLPNINFEANESHIIPIYITQYKSPKLPEDAIASQTVKLQKILSGKLIQSANAASIKGRVQFTKDLQILTQDIKSYTYFSWEQTLTFLSRLSRIVSEYHFKGKTIFADRLSSVKKLIMQQPILIDCDYIKEQLLRFLLNIAVADVIQDNKAQYQQAKVQSSTELNRNEDLGYMRQTIDLPKVLTSLQDFSNQLKSRRSSKSLLRNEQQLNFSYQRLLYEISQNLAQGYSCQPQSSQKKGLSHSFMQISPLLHNVMHILNNQETVRNTIADFVMRNNQNKQFHVILNAEERNLLQEAHHLINMRQIIQQMNMKKITSITPSGFSAVLAFLFCLNIAKKDIIQEIVGLDALVKTFHPQTNDKDIDIVDLLQKKVDFQERLYCYGRDKNVTEAKSKLVNKYPCLSHLFKELQSSFSGPLSYKATQVLYAIQRYDAECPDHLISQKRSQIQLYLQHSIEDAKKKQKKRDVLYENEQILREKILFNRIGISFSLNFLLGECPVSDNWLQIHKGQYNDLLSYKRHLLQLFRKFRVQPDITLYEFNCKNFHQIQIDFLLANQTELKYQYINGTRQPQIALIDLMLAAVSTPLYFGTYPLQKTHSNTLMNLNENGQYKLQPVSFHRYWSSNMFNPIPFNLLRPHHQQSTIFTFNFHSQPLTSISQQPSPLLRSSSKVIDHQQKKLKTLDLILFWWTKPKKLTPQLKEIMFGNIYESPMSRYFLFMLNQSYEHQSKLGNRKRVVDLGDERQYMLKAALAVEGIMGEGKDNVFVVKVRKVDGDCQLECIFESQSCQVGLFWEEREVAQGRKVKGNLQSKDLRLSFLELTGNCLKQTIISFLEFSPGQHTFFLQIEANTEGITAKEISFTHGIINYTVIKTANKQTDYLLSIEQLQSCEQPTALNNNYCPMAKRSSQVVNCLLNVPESDSDSAPSTYPQQIPQQTDTKNLLDSFIANRWSSLQF